MNPSCLWISSQSVCLSVFLSACRWFRHSTIDWTISQFINKRMRAQQCFNVLGGDEKRRDWKGRGWNAEVKRYRYNYNCNSGCCWLDWIEQYLTASVWIGCTENKIAATKLINSGRNNVHNLQIKGINFSILLHSEFSTKVRLLHNWIGIQCSTFHVINSAVPKTLFRAAGRSVFHVLFSPTWCFSQVSL